MLINVYHDLFYLNNNFLLLLGTRDQTWGHKHAATNLYYYLAIIAL